MKVNVEFPSTARVMILGPHLKRGNLEKIRHFEKTTLNTFFVAVLAKSQCFSAVRETNNSVRHQPESFAALLLVKHGRQKWRAQNRACNSLYMSTSGK